MKGLLTRVYTQNIDAIEFLAGLPPDKVSQSIRLKIHCRVALKKVLTQKGLT